MPCQKVIVTGAALAGCATAVAAAATAATTVGAACATAVAAGLAAAATVGATATTVALALVTAAACVGALGAGAVQAAARIPTARVRLGGKRMVVVPFLLLALEPAAGDALQEVSLDQDEEQHNGGDREGAGGHERVVVGPVLERECRQPDLDGTDLWSAGHDQRPEKTLPAL